MTDTIHVSVAWPYANGDLHVGHLAGAYLPADIFARYHRLKGSRVLLCGVAYKGDIEDLRESPALKVWDELEAKGTQVFFHDPYCPLVKRHGSRTPSVAIDPVDTNVVSVGAYVDTFSVVYKSTDCGT